MTTAILGNKEAESSFLHAVNIVHGVIICSFLLVVSQFIFTCSDWCSSGNFIKILNGLSRNSTRFNTNLQMSICKKGYVSLLPLLYSLNIIPFALIKQDT